MLLSWACWKMFQSYSLKKRVHCCEVVTILKLIHYILFLSSGWMEISMSFLQWKFRNKIPFSYITLFVYWTQQITDPAGYPAWTLDGSRGQQDVKSSDLWGFPHPVLNCSVKCELYECRFNRGTKYHCDQILKPFSLSVGKISGKYKKIKG